MNKGDVVKPKGGVKSSNYWPVDQAEFVYDSDPGYGQMRVKITKVHKKINNELYRKSGHWDSHYSAKVGDVIIVNKEHFEAVPTFTENYPIF